MPAGFAYQYNADWNKAHQYPTDINHNQKDILQTVKEQEAQFERLTRELEEERERVAHKAQQYRVGSETESMNSISSTDDTFQWAGPQDESLRFGDESHGLMDSCLHELEQRGTMNFGEDNMNYMPEDSYSGGGPVRGQYSSDYNMYNGGPHHDASLHSSHVSLHSNNSNRNNPRQMKSSHSNLGSRTSLPHDQPPPNGDNYAPYSSFQRNYDDYQGSPGGSPRGPGTPTRSNYYDDYGDSYHNPATSPPHAYEPNSHLQYGEQDSFENPMQLQPPRPESPNYIENYRGQPGDDRYAPQQPEDSFYRQSPMLERYPSDQGNQYEGRPGQDPRDNYMDQPGDGYRGDNRYMEDSFQDQRDMSFQGPPDYNGPQYGDRYGQPLNDSYQDGPQSMQPPGSLENRYGEPLDDSYRGRQDDSFRGPPPQDDSFRGQPPPGDRFDDDGYRDYGPDRYDDQPTNQSFQQDPAYPDNEPYRRHEGLPAVQDDPFADDPFRQKQRSLQQLRDADLYQGRSSPDAGSERLGPRDYSDGSPPEYNHMDGQPPYEQDSQQEVPRQYYGDEGPPPDMQMLRGPPPDDYMDDGRRTPSTQGGTMRWRAPELPEIIEYLSHPSEAIKANAAAYLTHLSYMDDGIKGKIRGMDGIPLLVDLLNSDFPEVHKNACSALKNLSYGRSNEENKKAIKNAGGIPALVRLLRKTQDEDVKDAVTGVLWNLSSSDDLKKAIIDDGLAVLVNVVIIPHSGWEKRGLSPYQAQEPWTTIFRNATGVLRNVSSAGPEARKKLRECHGLVESLIHTLRIAIEHNNMDNKPVENCVCTLRNLAFRIQEVSDPEFFKKRNATLQKQKTDKGDKIGCFGGGGKKKTGQKGKSTPSLEQMPNPQLPQTANEFKGLWGVDAVRYFLQLLQGANPVTLEASCGAIQNLAACDWKPAVEIRALVRKEKALPNLVDLLTYEVERVVGASATALRNLSVDEKNKDLVGKYAMKQLVSNLPQEGRQKEVSDDTLCSILACLNEVIQNNQDFCKSFILDNGLPRLMSISRNQNRYTPRTVKFAVSVLKTLWKVKVLHNEYIKQGYSEKDFNPAVLVSNASTPYSTINRPVHNMGYDDTTLSSRRGNYPNGHNTTGNPRVQGHSNPLINQQDRYGSRQERMDEVPLNDIGPGYAPLDDPNHHRNRPPVGGVALFPNLPPGQQPGNPAQQEPLYARVNKQRRNEMGGPPSPGNVMLGDQGQEGADSWV